MPQDDPVVQKENKNKQKEKKTEPKQPKSKKSQKVKKTTKPAAAHKKTPKPQAEEPADIPPSDDKAVQVSLEVEDQVMQGVDDAATQSSEETSKSIISETMVEV